MRLRPGEAQQLVKAVGGGYGWPGRATRRSWKPDFEDNRTEHYRRHRLLQSPYSWHSDSERIRNANEDEARWRFATSAQTTDDVLPFLWRTHKQMAQPNVETITECRNIRDRGLAPEVKDSGLRELVARGIEGSPAKPFACRVYAAYPNAQSTS
jgi:hypothetical protein